MQWTDDKARSIYLAVIIVLLVAVLYLMLRDIREGAVVSPEGLSRPGYVYSSGASMRHLQELGHTGAQDTAGVPSNILVVPEKAVEGFESDPLVATHEESLQSSLYAA